MTFHELTLFYLVVVSPSTTHLVHIFLFLDAFPHAFMCVCVDISVFAHRCKHICMYVLNYVKLDSASERKYIVLSVSTPVILSCLSPCKLHSFFIVPSFYFYH